MGYNLKNFLDDQERKRDQETAERMAEVIAANESRMAYLRELEEKAKTKYPEDYAKHSKGFSIGEIILLVITLLFIEMLTMAVSNEAGISILVGLLVVNAVLVFAIYLAYQAKRKNNLEKLAAVVEAKEKKLQKAIMARAEVIMAKDAKEKAIVDLAKEVMLLKNNYKAENDTGNILKNQIKKLEEQIATLQKEVADIERSDK